MDQAMGGLQGQPDEMYRVSDEDGSCVAFSIGNMTTVRTPSRIRAPLRAAQSPPELLFDPSDVFQDDRGLVSLPRSCHALLCLLTHDRFFPWAVSIDVFSYVAM